MKQFYETAQARDRAMFAKTMEWIKKEKIQKAVIITGGFHSTGMSELFKKENISFLRVQPRITQIYGRENYLKLMTETAHLNNAAFSQPESESLFPEYKKWRTIRGNFLDPFLAASAVPSGKRAELRRDLSAKEVFDLFLQLESDQESLFSEELERTRIVAEAISRQPIKKVMVVGSGLKLLPNFLYLMGKDVTAHNLNIVSSLSISSIFS